MNETAKPQPGDRAPDIRLRDGRGREVFLSSLWGQGPLALVFLRHLG